MLRELNEQEENELLTRYGGGWCDCPCSAIYRITPEMLAKYCIKRGFKPFPEPVHDEAGIRYQYLIKQTEHTDEKQNVKRVNVCASFGDYRGFAKATAEGIVQSLWRIAQNDRCSPDDIARQILGHYEQNDLPAEETPAAPPDQPPADKELSKQSKQK